MVLPFCVDLESDSDPHRSFLDSQSLGSVHSRDVIVIAKAGSHMYNLAMPTSDTDYIIVYRQPTQVSNCIRLHVLHAPQCFPSNLQKFSFRTMDFMGVKK